MFYCLNGPGGLGCLEVRAHIPVATRVGQSRVVAVVPARTDFGQSTVWVVVPVMAGFGQSTVGVVVPVTAGFERSTVETVVPVAMGAGESTVVTVPAIRFELRTVPVCVMVAIAAVVVGFGIHAVSIASIVVTVAVVWEVRLPEIG